MDAAVTIALGGSFFAEKTPKLKINMDVDFEQDSLPKQTSE